MRARKGEAVILAALLLAGTLAAFAVVPAHVSAYTLRDPILIVGDGAFTAANGVTGGSGVPSDPYRLEGWEVSAANTTGIAIRNTTRSFVIRGVYVHDGAFVHDGVSLTNVTEGRVEAATITRNANGIVVASSDRVVVVTNRITVSTYRGVAILASSNVSLSGNEVANNADGVYGSASSDLGLQGNSIWRNNQDGIYFYNCTRCAIEAGTYVSNGWTGVHLTGASAVSVYANIVSSNGRTGIFVDSADGVSVSSNTVFSNGGDGILAASSSNLRLEKNVISANRETGITLETSTASKVANNTLSQSRYGGIVLGASADLLVEKNQVASEGSALSSVTITNSTFLRNNLTSLNGSAAYAVGSDNLTFAGNDAWGSANGFAVDSSDNITFRENRAWDNQYGIYLFMSKGGRVFHNEFLRNAIQAVDDRGPENAWDDGYPSGGNYWSNALKVDRCTGPAQDLCNDSDGISDRPFRIDLDSSDRYPLMRPYGGSDSPPVADFLVTPASGNATTVFTFDATSSRDAEDEPSELMVRWDWNGDGAWDTDWSFDRMGQHRFDGPGTYDVRLEVRDSGGLTDVTSRSVVVGSSGLILGLEWPVFTAIVITAALGGAALVLYLRMRRSPGAAAADDGEGEPPR